jgi:hypothetical protein
MSQWYFRPADLRAIARINALGLFPKVAGA